MSENEGAVCEAQKAVTYRDVFNNVSNEFGNQPITIEDASLMQSAEAMALGQTQKGGAASIMQAAAEHNVKIGAVKADAHSSVADAGVTVTETTIPGKAIDNEYVGDALVCGFVRPLPTFPETASRDAITIGEALEAASVGAGMEAVELSDASAIQCAESRASGISSSIKGGLASTAQSAAELNPRVDDFAKTTIGDVLTDATLQLTCDKVVTQEDAAKVREAEIRHCGGGVERVGGVGAAMKTAADLNDEAGLISSQNIIKILSKDSSF